MKNAALIIGLIAVSVYCIGYLQKKRRSILLLNLTSRILYIIQYILLGAFEGAILDVAGSVSSVLAQRKDKGFIKKHTKAVFITVSLLTILAGIVTYKNFFSVLPIFGVLLHTSAFWIEDEKKIRLISLAGCPFWLVYNFTSGAYGSCIGDMLSIISLLVSIIRYDLLKPKKQQP